MTPDIERAFRELHPNLWARVATIECADGWRGILQDMARRLVEVCPMARLEQVKEKFGGLRVYADGPTANHRLAHAVMRRAEERSYTTCESCGAQGIIRGRGWYYVRCATCWDALQRIKGVVR